MNAVSDEKRGKQELKTVSKSGFFPQVSLKYFSLSLFMLLVFSFLLDKLIIPALEDEGKIVSHSWDVEDQFVYYWGHVRNKAELKSQPVWHSNYWPVPEKSTKRHRILVLGDSFIWGYGYDNMNDIWWRQLARELDRRGYKDVEVIAAGMHGLNTKLELDVAKKVIPKFKPDLVIWGYIPNDADELSNLTAADFDQALLFRPHRQNGMIEAFKGVYPHLSFQLIALRDAYLRKTRFGEFTKDNPRSWELGLLDGENWQIYSKTIDRTASYLNSLSVPSFMMLLPYECPGKLDFASIKAHYDQVFPKVRKAFEDRNVRVIDSYDTWIKAARGEEDLVKKGVLWFGINPGNAHPNRWATHAYGVHAADILEKDFNAILGAKTETNAKPPLHINDCIPPDLQIKQGGNKVVVVYPMKPDDFRSMPLRKPFIELSLELPVEAKEIRLGGEGLKSASLYVTNVDAKTHFDDGKLFSLGHQKGGWLKWTLPESRRQGINTINISATVLGRQRALILEFLN
jgi:hypothetical protein